MQTREPDSLSSVLARLRAELESLSPFHRERLLPLLIQPRQVAVADGTGDLLWVIAERGDWVLYREDVEEGWEWQRLDARGSISERQCNQFPLIAVAHEIFGPAPSDHPADV